MPSLRGLTVHVTDKEGNDLKEWGVQRLRSPTHGSVNGARVSAYIQSTTDSRFMISVKPRIPFVNVDNPNDDSYNDVVQRAKVWTNGQPSNYYSGPNTSQRSKLHGPLDRPDQGPKSRNSGSALSSPVPKASMRSDHPDYSLLATLYLDGRTEPERSVVIYLNPGDIDFHQPDGKVLFKYRWVQSENGRTKELAWVFRDNAIETVFDRLMINAGQARCEDQDMDIMIETMQSTGIDLDENASSATGSVGQIVVQIKRVVLGLKHEDHKYRPKHQEGHGEDVDMTGLKPDITHATRLASTSSFVPSSIRVVDYWSYKPDEGPWATFQFFYRSAEQLQKFGFEGFPVSAKPTRSERALKSQLLALPRFSITRLNTTEHKETKDGLSYEDKIKRKAFKPLDDEAKIDFGVGYRDAASEGELEEEEICKLTSLPNPRPKEPQLRPQRDVSLPGLVLLESETEPSMTKGIKTVQEGSPTDNDVNYSERPLAMSVAPALYGRKPDSNQGPKVHLRVDGSSNSGPLELSPFAAGRGSSITDLSEENIAKHSSSASNDHRLLLVKRVGNSEQEDDNDTDEPETESDLETHDGDEDFEYTANPEEEEADMAEQENLRSHLKKVEIGKRKYAQVKDAQDDGDGEQEGGADTVGGAVEDKSSYDEETPLLLTAEVTKDVHQGKKLRTIDAVDD